MAEGFRIAQGFVEIDTEDNTPRGLTKITASVSRWGDQLTAKMRRTFSDAFDSREATQGVSRLDDRLKSLASTVMDGVRSFASFGATVAGVTSLLGPLVNGTVAVAAATGQWLAGVSPMLALLPGLAVSMKSFGLVTAGVGLVFKEDLKSWGKAFEQFELQLGRVALQGLPALADGFVKVNLPVVEKGLTAVARSMNEVVLRVGEWVNSAAGQQAVSNIMRDVAAAAERLAPSVARLVISFGNLVARVGDPAIKAIAGLLADAADATARWVDSLTQADIDGAFKRMGDAAQYLVDKVKAVKDVVAWLSENQGAITKVSDSIAGIGIVLGLATGNWVAVAAGAVTLVLNHFDRVAPAVKVMADKAKAAFTAISNDPWVQKIAADVKVIAGLIRDDFATGLDWLKQKWEQLRPAVEQTWQVMGPFIDQVLKNPQVQDGLRLWAAALGGIAAAMLGLAAITGATTGLITASLSAFAAWLTGVFVSAVKSVPMAFTAAWEVVRSTTETTWGAIVSFFQGIPGQLSAVWEQVTTAASDAWGRLVAGAQELPGRVGSALSGMAAGVLYQIGFMTGQAVGAMVAFGAAVVGALVALPGQVVTIFTQVKDRAVEAVTAMASSVVAKAQALPGQVGSALSSLTSSVVTVFTTAKNQAVEQVTSMASSVVAKAQALPGQVGSALVSLGSQVAAKFTDAKNQAVTAATAMVTSVVSLVASLPGKAVAALGNVGTILAAAGRQLIQGFIDGIRSHIPTLDSVLSGITSRVPEKKGPPEKDRVLLEPAGRLVMRGFMRGIDAEAPALDRQLAGLTGMVGATRPAGQTAATGSGPGRASYYFAPGSVTLDASKIRSLQDLLDMLEDLRSTARQYGAVPVGV